MSNIAAAIPTELNGGNHTHAFAKAASTIAAHKACLDVSIALAATGIRVLLDDKFFERVSQIHIPGPRIIVDWIVD